MATTRKIKTNHVFTKRQLQSLNEELLKVSNSEVIALRGVNIEPKKDFADIEILKSPYVLDVFLSFLDISNPDFPKFNLIKINEAGEIDYEPKKTMQFNSLADRITFFNELEPINFYYE